MLAIGMGCQSLSPLTGGDAAPNDTFLVSPTSLAFGDAGAGLIACGSTPAPTAQLLLTNISSTSSLWWWTLGRGDASPYTLSTTCTAAGPCGLSPGNETITVTGPLVPNSAGLVSYDDTLTIFSAGSPDGGTRVALTASSFGSVLSVSPAVLNFGTHPATAPAGGYPKSLTVENTGNAEAIVALVSSSPAFQLPQASSMVFVEPGGQASVTVVFDPNGSATTFSGVLTEQPFGDLSLSPSCGASIEVTVEGQGSP